MWGPGYGGMMGGAGMWIVWILLLVGLGVLIWAVVRIASEPRHREGVSASVSQSPPPAAAPPVATSPGPSAASSPRQILKSRFAQGEIDADEYRERLRVLDED